MKDSNIHELYKVYDVICQRCKNTQFYLQRDSFGKRWVECPKCGEMTIVTWDYTDVNDESDTGD